MPAFLRAWQRELDEHYGRGGTTDARRRLRARLRDAGWSDEAVDALQEYLDWTSQHQDGVISKRAVEQPDPKSVIRGDVARYLLPNRRIMSREDEVGSTSAGTSASERMAGYNPSPKTAATTQDALRRIRRRLRAYLWRQWQNGANRFKELRQRGLPKFHAAVAAGCVTHISTASVSPVSMFPPRLNPIEPPWYGPVCPVVWEGRCREAFPYPDQALLSDFWPAALLTPAADRRKQERGDHTVNDNSQDVPVQLSVATSSPTSATMLKSDDR